MFRTVSRIYTLMSRRERRKALLVFALMLAAAFVDMLGVASVMPFVAVLATPDIVSTNRYLNAAYEWLGFESTTAFMIALGAAVLVVFVGSLALKGLTNYAILRFSHMRSHTFSYRLLGGYMAQPYEFFLGRNTSEMSKTIFSEVGEVIHGVLIPALKLISGGAVTVFIAILLLWVDPILTVAAAVVLGGSFLTIYMLTRNLLDRLGRQRVADNAERFVVANEALNGIKELQLMGRGLAYLNRFGRVSERFASQVSVSKVIGDIPHLAVQAIAFGGLLMMVLYLMGQHGSLGEAMPLIALYAFAAYRLLPAFQEVYKNTTQLRYYGPALDHLHSELAAGSRKPLRNRTLVGDLLEGDIELRDISYSYPEAGRPVISSANLRILAGSSVAFVGSTGAGKSTVVDLVMGLLLPQQGEVLVGGEPLTASNMERWQRSIGYVPQSIFLADASVAENIAFGIPKEEIDQGAVERAARAAHIHDFIVEELPEGYRSEVGERGVRLSGGQRQRLGIARALYHDPRVVVFDEATSALDGTTEMAVMEAMGELAGDRTVILIAHRLKTIRNCDTIFLLSHGRIVASGTYDELLSASDDFKQLAADAAA